RAVQLEFPNLRRLKPQRGEPTGQYVSLDAERWDREAVNDVLRNHRQFDCASLRHVESVDLGLTVRLLRLPHPLLGDDVYLDRIGRRLCLVQVQPRAPGKWDHRQPRWNECPRQLDRPGPCYAPRDFVARSLTVAHAKDQDGYEDAHC